MSTIRPLATIALLAVLGVYLAYEINKGPIVAVDDQWSQPAPDADEAPAWGEARPVTPTAIEAPSFETPVAATAPELPDVPELPALPTPAPPAAPQLKIDPPRVSTATNETLVLPDNIPQANYGGTPAEPPAGITGSVPSLGTSTTAAPALPELPAAAPSAPSGFAADWDAIQSALTRDQLPQAHRMLSKWRGEEGLTAAQRQQVEQLLGELAGTLVYSTDHRLEPPHRVAPNETLATIAQQYSVPWQLLAKINGIASAEAVQPGQVLKVVRGPFAASVDLRRGELVLMLDDRYAGKFPVRVEGVAPGAGEWRVGQKKLDTDALGLAAEQKVVLENQAGQRLELSSGPTPTPGASGRLTIASNDLADLYDILSVGSEVKIVR